MKDIKNSAKYQSPCRAPVAERRTEDFSSPITQWLSSPFCQLDMLSPNDGSLAFSISSPVPLSPFRNSSNAKSPGDFSPSIFSSLKESSFFDDSEHLLHKSGHKTDLSCFDIEGEDDVSRGFEHFDSSVRSQTEDDLEPLSRGAMKKSLMYGRLASRACGSSSKDKGHAMFSPSLSPSPSLQDSPSPSPSSRHRDLSDSSSEADSALLEGRSQRVRSHASVGGHASSASYRGARASTHSEAPADKGVSSQDEITKCNCKKSKCLKLYCECFVAMKFCRDSCKCLDCYNNSDHEGDRQEAIRITKTRNGTAFQAKVSASLKVHLSGCNCKQSQCLKKYCECFTGGALCASNCKCHSCQNFEGSESLASARRLQSSEVSACASLPLPLPVSVSVPRRLNPEEVFLDKALVRHGGEREAEYPAGEDRGVATGKAGVGFDFSADEFGRRASRLSRSEEVSDCISPPNSDGKRYSSRSTRNAVAADPAYVYSVPRMSTRGLSRQGSFPAGDATAPVSADNKSKSRRAGTGTSPNGVAELASPVGLQFGENAHARSNAPVGASYHDVNVGKKHGQTSAVQSIPPKRRHIDTSIVYEFFGPHIPPTPKIIALRCLEFLDGPNLYNMSLVNTLWCKAAMDEALWE